MNKYFKEFLHRGLMFSGFGPIVFGIIVLCISFVNDIAELSAYNILMGIFSTYAIAFVQAGATVFNQIEDWPMPKSLFCHFVTLYVAYSLCYILNYWIPFEPMVLLIFALVFIAVYFVVWLTVYLIVRATRNQLNRQLK